MKTTLPGASAVYAAGSTSSRGERMTSSQSRSISARGQGSMDTIRVRRLWSRMALRANRVEWPEPTSRYVGGLWLASSP